MGEYTSVCICSKIIEVGGTFSFAQLIYEIY